MVNDNMLNNNQYFEISMISIGGLGAYTIGKMLGDEISKIKDIKTSVFASYSSEKKGAPVNVYLRIIKNQKAIYNYASIKHPHLMVVFKEELLTTNLAMLEEDSILLINTNKDFETLKQTYNLPNKHIYLINAQQIANYYHVKLNMILFGALHQVLTFLDPQSSQNTIKKMLEDRYKHLCEANINAFLQGYKHCNYYQNTPQANQDQHQSVLGIEDQLVGGYINGYNSYLQKRYISREGYKPAFNKALCINCAKCDFTCPDDCFVWKEVVGRNNRVSMQLQGIDYDYCKGCMRCVNICPTQALSKVEEDTKVNSVKKGYEIIGDLC